MFLVVTVALDDIGAAWTLVMKVLLPLGLDVPRISAIGTMVVRREVLSAVLLDGRIFTFFSA